MTAVGAAALLVSTPKGSVAQDSHLVVIGGLSGAPLYRERFQEWALALLDAAREAGVAEENRIWLAQDPESDPRVRGRSDRETVQATLSQVARTAGPDDRIFVVLVGHGSHRGGESRFNLPGPDLSAGDFRALLEAFGEREVVFVNTASASGGFVETLSGPNRTVITATRSGREANETVFGGFFVRAFAGESADTDKDGRVSILEAFQYARHGVARSYQEDDRLQTEHALLDDDGDGEGAEDPDPRGGGDGSRASLLFLSTPDAAARATAHPRGEPADTILRRLYREKAALEARIAELRALRGEMETERYEAELEDLLVELTLTSREIEEREGGDP